MEDILLVGFDAEGGSASKDYIQVLASLYLFIFRSDEKIAFSYECLSN